MNEYKTEINETALEEINEQAIYNMIMYMPLESLDIQEGISVESIIGSAKEKANTLNIDKGVLEALIEFEQSHPDSDVLKATISNMSHMSDDKLIQNTGAFSAAVFTDPDGNMSRHAEDLSEYKSMCIQTESEFVQALNCYA